MKKNKKRKHKMSASEQNTSLVVGLILVVLVAACAIYVVKAHVSSLERAVVEKEEQLKKLDESLEREMARWEEMKTTEKLETALVKHGLAMHYPKPAQIVRIKPNGKPYPGQLSLAKAEMRAKNIATASSAPLRKSRRN